MLERTWGGSFPWKRDGRCPEVRKPSRVARRPQVETMEGRQLLTASIATLSAVSVPSGMGYQVALDGSASGNTDQTFTVTSSNPDIIPTVATGAFVTTNVTHTASSTSGDTSFSGSYVYQFLGNLVPNTTARIQKFTNGGGYNGSEFYRVATDFSGTGGATDTVIQGGPQPETGTTDNPLEPNQQLAFLEPGVMAIANSNSPTSTTDDTDAQQFFITAGPQTSLDYGYTVYGQVVSGENVITEIGAVPTTTNSTTGFPEPDSPVTITSETVSNTSPSGDIELDTRAATPGETGTITVTVKNPADGTTSTQSFGVTITANTDPTTANFTLAPTAFAATQTVASNTATPVQLTSGSNNNFPTSITNPPKIVTSYKIVTEPTHGTITNFNAAKGTFDYTPTSGYTGTDSVSFQAINTGGTPATISGNVAKVTFSVETSPPANTGAVRQIGTVLVVTPPPVANLKATNNIVVDELNYPATPANNKITVTVNGTTDLIQPLTSAINEIVVYGTKANDNITVTQNVSPLIAVFLNGGPGGKNTIQAGAGTTIEHGYNGQNTLIGGDGSNQLLGAKGHVKFKPTTTTNQIFAAVPHPGYTNYHYYHGKTKVTLTPPGGTFYKYVKGKTVEIPTPKAPKR